MEVEEPADEQAIETAARVDLHWLHRSGRGSGAEGGLEARARALPCPDAGTIVWIAAEASVVRSLRQHALQAWGLDRSRLHAAGYWKRGQADHRDEEASG